MPRFRRHLLAGVALLAVPAFGSAGPAAQASSFAAPIQHVVVLMQENRSFDSYLGRLHFEGQPASTPLSLSRHNPGPRGKAVYVFHKHRYCEKADLDHSWNGTHHEYDHGKMDGFAKANAAR